MNILMIAGRIPHPPLDGGSARVYHLARQWSRRHRVTLVAPQFAPLDSGLLATAAAEMGVELHAVPVRLAPRLRRAAGYVARTLRGGPASDFYPELSAALGGLAGTHSFDVVEMEGSGAGLYLPALASLKPRPRLVLVFYDVMWDWWRREFMAAPRPVSLVRWLTHRGWEPRLVRQADCCVFMSERDAAIVSSVVKPRSMLVVPNGMQTGFFEATPVPDSREVLFVGSLAHLPNQQAVRWLLGEIWPALQRRVPNARLTIVGREPPAQLVALARSARVTVVGDAPDVRPYYARARAVVVPLRSGGGIRVKILEALAAGRPLVTTRLGAEGLPLVPGEHALFADRAEEMAAELARLLADQPLAERLASNGRTLVEREFDWESLARRQESAFHPVR